METCVRPCPAGCGVSFQRREAQWCQRGRNGQPALKLVKTMRREAPPSTQGYRQSSLPMRSSCRPKWIVRAGALDVMPTWTLDQIAGLVFGAVMVVSVASARQMDVLVARAQRRQMGLCEECGGLYEPGTCQQGNCPAKK